jgi:hypothetical protein
MAKVINHTMLIAIVVSVLSDFIAVAFDCAPRYRPNLGIIIEFLPFALAIVGIPVFAGWLLLLAALKKLYPHGYDFLLKPSGEATGGIVVLCAITLWFYAHAPQYVGQCWL